MFKKVITLLLVVVLTAVAAIGGTLAYLQDTDEDVNVMTLGNVYIDQIEEQRVDSTKGGTLTAADIEPFEQGKQLYPYVEEVPNKAMGDEYEVITFPNGKTNKLFIGDNAIDKFVAVTNTGKSDAYVRSIIALEAPTAKIDLSFNSKDWAMDKTASSYSIELDGVKYDLFVCNYKEILKPKETTPYSLLQVLLDWTATNEDVEAYGDTYDVLVLSQAVQTAGFANAQTALDTAFGAVTAESAKAWFSGMDVPVYAADGEDAAEAIMSGESVIVDKSVDIVRVESTEAISYNGNGATVTMNGVGSEAYGYLAFIPAAGKAAEVSNLTVDGSGFVEIGHYGIGGGNYTVNNLVIEDFVGTVAVNDGANKVSPAFCHYGNATLTNCTLTGATAVDAAAKAYDAGFTNGTKTFINGGEYGKIYLWSQAHVTINGAEIDEIDSAAITTKNLGKLTIGAGTHVGTINLVCSNSYTPALTIEEGATVDTIVYKGVTYTQADWLAR